VEPERHPPSDFVSDWAPKHLHHLDGYLELADTHSNVVHLSLRSRHLLPSREPGHSVAWSDAILSEFETSLTRPKGSTASLLQAFTVAPYSRDDVQETLRSKTWPQREAVDERHMFANVVHVGRPFPEKPK